MSVKATNTTAKTVVKEKGPGFRIDVSPFYMSRTISVACRKTIETLPLRNVWKTTTFATIIIAQETMLKALFACYFSIKVTLIRRAATPAWGG